MTQPPTTLPPDDAKRKRLVIYRAAGVAVAAAMTALTAVYGSAAPWVSGALAVLEAVVIGGIGIALGVPIDSVLELALEKLTKRKPERAAELAVGTLASLPPAASVTATQALFASLPPDVRGRASITPSDSPPTAIEFVGIESVHPPPLPVPRFERRSVATPVVTNDETTQPSRPRSRR